MNTPKDEYLELRHRVRYYRRQAWASTAAFVVAVALLAITITQSIESRAELTKASAVIEEQAKALKELDAKSGAMHHHILGVQGRVNACRIEHGLPAIEWDEYP